MRRLTSSAAVLLVLPLGVAPVAAQSPDTVALRFGWPAELRAQVEVERTRTRTGHPSSAGSSSARLGYRLAARAHAEGLVVGVDSFVVQAMPRGGAQAAQELQGLWPAFLVDSAGEFVRVLDRAAVRRETIQLITEGGKRRMDDATRRITDVMLSDAAIDGMVAQDWNSLVGTWTDADFTIGESLVMADTVPSPMLPDLMVSMQTRFTALGREACTPGEAERRCVRLEMRSRPQPGAAGAMTEAMLSRLGGDSAAVAEMRAALAGMQMETVVTLVTEPRTLVPYELRTVKEVSVEVRESAAAAPQRVSQRDEKVLRFRYPAGSAPQTR